MKKRLLSLLIAGVMTAGLLSGCGASEDTQNQSDSAAQSDQSADESSSDIETNAEDTSDGGASDGKTLVVYYSATGNTEAVANYIADATGGDLFELEPVEPYTDDDLNYNDENSRVSQEYADESLRDVELVSATVEGFDEYENIFVGYPIWWQVAAWPVNQFIENNDFTGKTVIPFCTSASSGIGDSGQLLEEMAGTGNWLEGQRFRSSVSEEDVVAWVDSLGL
ncbi:flavodoxin [Merdimonas faecis]|uniref:flavodoxin n=1 Tax=Merdimonas faecis TaxID=1653435 RepID=UPI0022E6851B|nr:flavodoxin [Merdimonas faecis]